MGRAVAAIVPKTCELHAELAPRPDGLPLSTEQESGLSGRLVGLGDPYRDRPVVRTRLKSLSKSAWISGLAATRLRRSRGSSANR